MPSNCSILVPGEKDREATSGSVRQCGWELGGGLGWPGPSQGQTDWAWGREAMETHNNSLQTPVKPVGQRRP